MAPCPNRNLPPGLIAYKKLQANQCDLGIPFFLFCLIIGEIQVIKTWSDRDSQNKHLCTSNCVWRVVVQGCMGEWRKYSYIVKHCRQQDECRTSWILTSCRFTAIASVPKFCGHKLRLVLGGYAPSIDQSSWPAGVQPWRELKPLSAASSSIPRASTSSCIIRMVLTLRKQRIPFKWIINQLRH